MKRIAVDIGGTFTDLIYVDDETGEFKLDKVRTTPQQPEKAVLESIQRTGIDIGKVSIFIHLTSSSETVMQFRFLWIYLMSFAVFLDDFRSINCIMFTKESTDLLKVPQ